MSLGEGGHPHSSNTSDSQQTHEGGERTGMIVVLSTVLVLAMLVVCLFCYTYTSVGQTLVNTERLKLIQ